MTNEVTYPLGQRFSISFSVFEDRLVLVASLADATSVRLLLTRRMVLLLLQQILRSLPDLTGLKQTHAAYWQEVLQLSHQQALQQKEIAENSADLDTRPVVAEQDAPVFLATGLSIQLQAECLVLAFNGLPRLETMQETTNTASIVALKLETEHLHQVLQILISKAEEAEWHLPVDLPWLEANLAETLPKGQVQH